jgi:hypothetical protein
MVLEQPSSARPPHNEFRGVGSRRPGCREPSRSRLGPFGLPSLAQGHPVLLAGGNRSRVPPLRVGAMLTLLRLPF